MRTLYEIIEAVKDGDEATHEECRIALHVMTGLMNLASAELLRISGDATLPSRVRAWGAENHRRYHRALNADPVAYLGDDVPGNPNYDAFRTVAKKVVDAAAAGTLSADTPEGRMLGRELVREGLRGLLNSA